MREVEYISALKAGQLSGFSTHTIINCCARGQLKHWRVPGWNRRGYKINPLDLANMLTEQGVPVPAALANLINGKAKHADEAVRDSG